MFAYGGNMSLKNINKRDVFPFASKVAILENYKLLFNKISWNKVEGEISYASVQECEGNSVEGILHIITQRELEIIDYWEGYPNHYFRKTIPLKIWNSNKIVNGQVYIASPKYIKEGVNPPNRYLKVIEDGKKFIEELKIRI